ncbi:MAG: tetratricopeptide repeat protein, partial [Candidatus Binataceae bacterium]
FMVRTDGPDGTLHEYQIKYTFGVSPLQQYLIAFSGGRLQAFGVAWDSRPHAAGGQRWFALYPGPKSRSDQRRWTAIDQTWNYMCADCHSTNVRKNYDPQTRAYATTYAEIDVGCEACHGPGSAHVAWAKHSPGYRQRGSDHGLTIALDDRAGISWGIDPVNGEVRRNKPLTNHREIEMCARCHSRRAQIHEDYVHGQPLGDDYRVALLKQGLYFSDGQIDGEVYEYGSFIQSRMYHEGVTCSDCHDPHSAGLRAAGNNLCTRCHLRDRYDSPRHYHHPAGSSGSRCVACHMPARTYMLIDRRRDHSIRIPRPDLSIALGTPNACNNCHADKTPLWAADYVAKWYGRTPIGFQRFGPALQAGRLGAPGAQRALAELAANPEQPAIARATALAALSDLDGVNRGLLRKAAKDESPLVRRAIAQTLAKADPEADPAAMSRLLEDPVRVVRIEAAESLAGAPSGALPASVAGALDRASAQYLAAQQFNADRPEAHFNLGIFFAKRANIARARSELADALSIDPSFSPAAVNLADLFRQTGRDDRAEAVLREAMRHAPDDASLPYALGLLEIRQKHRARALDLLAAAAHLAPSNPRYAYVYAIALNDTGDTNAAIDTLERSLRLNPYHRDSLAALVSLCDRAGDHAKALKYAQLLNELDRHGLPPGYKK